MSFLPAQCHAARLLLKLSQNELANAAHVNATMISRFEQDESRPGYNNLQAIRVALETAGIEFLSADGGGAGVRLRKRRKGDVPGEVVFFAELCRAARCLLDWHQVDLAEAAAVARSTVAEFERRARQTSARKLAAMQTALEDAGVVFIAPNGGGPGVRLRK